MALKITNKINGKPVTDWKELKEVLGLSDADDKLINCNKPVEGGRAAEEGIRPGILLASWMNSVDVHTMDKEGLRLFLERAYVLGHSGVDELIPYLGIQDGIQALLDKGWTMEVDTGGSSRWLDEVPFALGLSLEELRMVEHARGESLDKGGSRSGLFASEKRLVMMSREVDRHKHPNHRFCERYNIPLSAYEDLAANHAFMRDRKQPQA